MRPAAFGGGARRGLGEALRFGAVGLVNTAVGLGVIYLVMAATPAGPYLANATGYAVGLCVSFTLNRRWTFRSPGRIGGDAGRFLLAFAAAYALNLAVLRVSVADFGLSPWLAQPMAMAAYTMSFFTLSKVFVFRAP